MANPIQITMDAARPRALGEFWCAVLGYVEQPAWLMMRRDLP